eukprot:Seg5340.1 transcript_id=Seg5340.1/GoldUCD/mRNA.D3Y31 product="hypothetical protein" protein_id=Seg5340.1/GoldUCD/D3Y31
MLVQNNTTLKINIAHVQPLYGCDGEVQGLAPMGESVAYAVFLLLQLLLSVFGNSLVCLAIIRFNSLQTLTNSFIFSLAITDLVTPFVRVLFAAVAMLRLEWIFGCFWCKLSSVLGVFLCASSIMHLCAISVERFIVIRWPLQHHHIITKKRVIAVLVNIWITALVLSLFPYFGIVELAFNPELLDCEIHWNEDPKMAIMLACAFFLLPFLLMLVSYYYIFQEVQTQTRKISSLQVSTPVGDQRGRHGTIGVRLRVGRILRQELKAVKIIIVVVGLFFAFWLPFFVILCIRAYLPELVSGIFQRLAFVFAYSNSCCNWIVYSIMNRDLRRAFKRMLSACGCCFTVEQEHTWIHSEHVLRTAAIASPGAVRKKSESPKPKLSSRNGVVVREHDVEAIDEVHSSEKNETVRTSIETAEDGSRENKKKTTGERYSSEMTGNEIQSMENGAVVQ